MNLSIASLRLRFRPAGYLPALSIAALASTVLLILVGSIVRVTGNGLGCPDWPLCYGQAIPPSLTGAWVEFSHRLLGALTSAQVLLLAALCWRERRSEPRVLVPGLLAAGLVMVQIGLGGLHVLMELPGWVGWVHTGNALLIVGALAVVAGQTTPGLAALRPAALEATRGTRLPAWASLNAALLYLLLLSGSYVTRTGASLACPGFPRCASGMPGLPRLIEIHMLHRILAYTVVAVTVTTVIRLVRRTPERRLRRLAATVGELLVVQFGLGISNVLLRLPMWSRALHLTVGASFWAGVVILWALTRPAPRREQSG